MGLWPGHNSLAADSLRTTERPLSSSKVRPKVRGMASVSK